MGNYSTGEVRPPIHLLAAESDMVARLALQAEHRFPVVAAMLLAFYLPLFEAISGIERAG